MLSDSKITENTHLKSTELKPVNSNRVAIGDTVRVRYLNNDNRIVQFKITLEPSDIDNGLINYKTPIAEAILDSEEGDEIEILVGSYLKSAVIEKILSRENA